MTLGTACKVKAADPPKRINHVCSSYRFIETKGRVVVARNLGSCFLIGAE